MCLNEAIMYTSLQLMKTTGRDERRQMRPTRDARGRFLVTCRSTTDLSGKVPWAAAQRSDKIPAPADTDLASRRLRRTDHNCSSNNPVMPKHRPSQELSNQVNGSEPGYQDHHIMKKCTLSFQAVLIVVTFITQVLRLRIFLPITVGNSSF